MYGQINPNKKWALRLTAGITMLTLFQNENIVFAPFVLPQNNWSFDSGKTNGVMPADVSCNWLQTILLDGSRHGQ